MDEASLWRAAGLTVVVNWALVAGAAASFFSRSGGGGITGWVCCAGAVWAFGSYGVLLKMPAVAATHPQVFQLYFSMGVCALLAGLVLVRGGAPVAALGSPWGFVGAALWLASMLCAKTAVDGIGYGVGVAAWASITMLVAFAWGAFVFREPVASAPGAAAALGLLVAGVVGVAKAQAGTTPSLVPSSEVSSSPLIGRVDEAPSEAARRRKDFGPRAVGWVGAVGCGLFNGSVMVPFHYFTAASESRHEDVAMAYVANFAVGILAVTPLAFVASFGPRPQSWPGLRAREVAWPGLVTGLFWATGNVFSTYTTVFLGQAVGYPLTQTCIVVAGGWGFYFGEIRGRRATALFAASIITILAGAALLGLDG